jgi:hypothetical protein
MMIGSRCGRGSALTFAISCIRVRACAYAFDLIFVIHREHLRCMIDRIALERTDVDRIIHYSAPTRELARMLADEPARQRERIILADQANGIRKAACTNQ